MMAPLTSILRWLLLLCLALAAPTSQAGVLLLGGSGQSAGGEDLSNLVLRYTFDNSGDRCEDTAGVGPYDCTEQGTPTYNASGTGFGDAITLNGSTQYITHSTTPQPTTGDWSYALCIKRDTATGGRMAFYGAKDSSASNATGVYLALFGDSDGADNDRLFVQIADGDSNELFQYNTALTDTASYHSIQLLLDRSGVTATLYLDGSSVATGDITGESSTLTSTSTPAVGARNTGSISYYFQGRIAEYRLYNALMTAGQRSGFDALCQ